MPAGGKQTITDSGKFGIRSGGGFDVCDDCCGCTEGCVSGSTIAVTAVNINSGRCGACYIGSPDNKVTDVKIDATYSVGGYASPAGTGDCRWQQVFSGGATYVTLQLYSSSDGTCTTPTSQNNGTTMTITVDYDIANSRFSQVIFDPYTTGSRAFRYLQSTDGGSYDFGDPIPDGNTACSAGGPAPLAVNGTVTIECE